MPPHPPERPTLKLDLLDQSYDDLVGLLQDWGQPAYRVQQLWRWLYVHLAADPAEMSNLPQGLRARLAQEIRIGGLTPLAETASADGETVKGLFQLPDGVQIETVLMGYEARHTVCVSTQAGCAMGCTFCATGQMGFQRNLSAGEIVAQALFYARQLAQAGERLSNVVLMGMGEPLANYEASLAAIRRLIHPDGFNLGQRRITLSTVGLIPGIERFSREGLQVNLAVSLHAATDALRDQLVPVNRRYPLDPLFEACRAYVARTRRRITFEWALIAGLNDTPAQAAALAERTRGLLCHVNLIPLNPSGADALAPSSAEGIAAFQAELDRRGVSHSLRLRRGIDIQAGCGQLRRRHRG